jgi:DNA-binding NarL/FixJ family response regulator
MRSGICSLIATFGNFNVIIQASNCNELIETLKKSDDFPDVFILEICIQSGGMWNIITEIRALMPSAQILILTVLRAAYIVNNILKFNANGYLHKNCPGDELKGALMKIHTTGMYFSSATTKLMDEYSKKQKEMTRPEIQFLKYLSEDLKYAEIAQRMNVSPRTIDNYRDSLYDKLSIKTKVGLIMHAIKCGIVNPFGS